MEENTRKPTSHSTTLASLSLEPNGHKLKLMNNNNTQEYYCNKYSPSISSSSSSKGKAKLDTWLLEEGHDGDENYGKVIIEGRERVKRQREEVMGKVKVPENWGQEKLLKEWIDYTTFDGSMFAPHRLIVAARDALVADVRKAKSQRLRIPT